MIMSIEQRKRKIKPRIKLNCNIYIQVRCLNFKLSSSSQATVELSGKEAVPIPVNLYPIFGQIAMHKIGPNGQLMPPKKSLW